MKNPSSLIAECAESQLRQYVDSAAAFRHLQAAKKEAAEVRGGMIWREVGGKRYLVRTRPSGSQHSLGPDSADNRKVYESFTARKRRAEETLAARKQALEQMRKLNRAYGVGRTPQIVIDVLNAIEKAGIAEQFLTIGTHAIYAYEAAAGVRVTDGALATRDLDLLFDTRQHIAFMTTMSRIDSSFIKVLHSADKSFRAVDGHLPKAINKDGFEVHLVRRVARDGDPHPLLMSASAEDLWAEQVETGNRLISARRFDQVVVSPRGEMALMRTVHPLDFVAVKRELAARRDRDAAKAPKDKLQAEVIQYLWDETLSHMHASSADAPAQAKATSNEAGEDDRSERSQPRTPSPPRLS